LSWSAAWPSARGPTFPSSKTILEHDQLDGSLPLFHMLSLAFSLFLRHVALA
jgi:hypothetical protein